MSFRRRLIPAALAAAMVLLSGCTSTAGRAAALLSRTNAVRTTTAQSAAPGPAAAATPSSGTADKVNAAPGDCLAVAERYGAVAAALLPELQGATGSAPFDADKLSTALSTTTGSIPAELAPDFAAFEAAVQQLRGKDLTAAAALISGPAITTAMHDIDTFVANHC